MALNLQTRHKEATVKVKKIKKWVCKLCGEKQSVKKVFNEGTGAECRVCVQQLNLMRGEMENESLQAVGCDNTAEEVIGDCGNNEAVQELLSNESKIPDHNAEQKSSRWKRFMSDEYVEDDGDDDCEDMVVTTFGKAKNSWQPRKKRKRDKILVDATLLQYPARKQQISKKLSAHWSSAETVQHGSGTSVHQSTLSTVNSFLFISPVQQNLSLCSSYIDTQHNDVKLSDADENNAATNDAHFKTTSHFDGDLKQKCSKTFKNKVTSTCSSQSKMHVSVQQRNQIKSSKWKKFMVDHDPNIDETETECYGNNIPETENVSFDSLNVNKCNGFPRDAKAAVSVKTHNLSNSHLQIPEKVSPLQSKLVGITSYKPENQGFFHLDNEELEDGWWKV